MPPSLQEQGAGDAAGAAAFAPSPREPGSAAAPGSLALLASGIFDALADGREEIGPADLERWAGVLARSSGVAGDPGPAARAFGRLGLGAGGGRFSRADFARALEDLQAVVDVRELAAALGRAHGELRQPGAGGGGSGPQRLDSLETRGRVLERMLGYFRSLQETYDAKLRAVQSEQEELLSRQTQEERQAAVAPPPARLFAPFARRASGELAGGEEPEEGAPEAHQPSSSDKVAPEDRPEDVILPSTGLSKDARTATEADEVEEREEEEEEEDEDEEEEEGEEEEEDDDEDDAEDEEEEEESDDDAVGEAEEEEEDEADATVQSDAAIQMPDEIMKHRDVQSAGDVETEVDAKVEVDAKASDAEVGERITEAKEEKAKCTEEEPRKEEEPLQEEELREGQELPADVHGGKPSNNDQTPKAGKRRGKGRPKAKAKAQQAATPAAARKRSPAPEAARRPAAGREADASQLREARRGPTPDLRPRPASPGPGRAPSPAHRAPAQAQRQPRRRADEDDEECVRCVQTLELGLAVRSAICLGREVWTVDWAGNVTIRSREDASQVSCEIPTNKFVWCMMTLEPGLMLLGQESQGIAVFDIDKKQYKGALTGGHCGGVGCLALDDGGIGDLDEHVGPFPRRRLWSGSNDFTIRKWDVETWRARDPTPAGVEGGSVFDLGRWKIAVARGQQMHGHRNGVRALLRIGPTLWSASDDGSIRLWACADGTCMEVVDEAHRGSVLKLVIVRTSVWSAGADGLIKEWTIGGGRRQCLRQVAPEGSEKGVYALVPLGNHVWTCGHHPSIQVLSQKTLESKAEHRAHEPYISNLLSVDRIETRIVWSTSLGDRMLKVWRHTIRGNQPSMDELRAANRLYEVDAEEHSSRLNEYVRRSSNLDSELTCSAQEYKEQLDKLMQDFGKAREEADTLKEQKKYFEDELSGLRQLFEDAGLARLLEDPKAMQEFLQRAARLEQVLQDLGLAHLLDDPEELRRMMEAMKQMGDFFERHGLGDILRDPEKLAEMLEGLGQLREFFERHGLGDILKDPAKLAELLENLGKLQELAEKHGLGDIFKDPSKLAELLAHYEAMKQAFNEYGFSEHFEDPYSLKGFLRNYAKLREAFAEIGLEYLLDSAAAMKDFLKRNGQGEQANKELAERTARLEAEAQQREARLAELERSLAERERELGQARGEAEELRGQLAAYQAYGDLESLAQWKADAADLKRLRKLKGSFDSEMDAMRTELEEKEKERFEALERERMMALKYKELDIFKLDIIARELKALDGELGYVGKSVKSLQNDTAKLRNYDEQQQIGLHGTKMLDQCVQLRAHIRDVINKCLSETQKLHVGIAIDDYLAAGELKDGGKMAGWVCEEVDVPDYGSSKAGRLRHGDEMQRDRRLHPTGSRPPSPKPASVTLPRIESTRRIPSPTTG